MTVLIWILLAVLAPYVAGSGIGILLFWPAKPSAKTPHKRMDLIAATLLLAGAGAGLMALRAQWAFIPALLCFAFGAAVGYEGGEEGENPCLVTHLVALALCPLAGRELLPYVGWYED